MAMRTARMRAEYRKSIDEQWERQHRTNMRIFHEALISRGTDARDIEALERELDDRLRGNKKG